MSYIKVNKAFEKLKKAEEFYSPVIFTAACGYGKSSAVKYYYRRKSCCILYCKDGNFTEMPDIASIRASVVIVEDMQWLYEKDSINYLKELLRTPGIQVVMLTRGEVPRFLSAEDLDLGFVRIKESDLTLDVEGVKSFFAEHDVEISDEDAVSVAAASKGYVRAVYYYAVRMEGGVAYSEGIRQGVRQDLFKYWDTALYDMWLPEFTDFALSVCRYKKFNLEMAEYLTGNRNLWQVIQYCKDTMHQLVDEGDDYYSFRFEMKKFYCWKQENSWTKEAIQDNYRKAAHYYDVKGDATQALRYYDKAGDMRGVKELLIRNANTHPGLGHYVEFKDYYLKLPREEILGSPAIIAGLSMLYSLILEPEKSKEWYNELKAFEQNRSNSKELRREARCRLAYLDIGLPHKGTRGIIKTMKNIFTLMGKGDIRLPELSATGNVPSIMNGGLDFSDWSKNDTQIAKFMSVPVEIITGKYGKGLVTLALAESGFEKNTMGKYEVLTRCNDGFQAAAGGGTIEMCFVSVGIQTRQHVVEGQIPSAKRIYESFKEKTKEENARHLIPNIEAMGAWLSLFAGAGKEAENFVQTVPDPRVYFAITDRYRLMQKVRCLIALGREQEALDIADFLTGYFTSYDRHIHYIEIEVLKSIIFYHMGAKEWKEHILTALKKAQEYHFVRLISLEGAAILPVLIELRAGEMPGDITQDFLEEVYQESIKVASFYPDYLRHVQKENVQLTKRESQVLSMLCAGMSTEEICDILNISYEGLKKHNRGIYRKLGAKNRAEAERKATQMGLVYRGDTN